MRKLILGLALGSALLLSGCGVTPSGDSIGGTPKAPANVTATPGPGYMTVSWDDVSDNETGFAIYRETVPTADTASLQSASKIGSVEANTTSYIDFDIALEQGYRYSVSALGSGEESSDPIAQATEKAVVPVGVDLMVGTNHRRYDDGTGTIFLAYFVFPKEVLEDEQTPFDLSIKGPPGWNGGESLAFTLLPSQSTREDGHAMISRNTVDAVAGTYTLEVGVGGKTYTATHAFNSPDFKLGLPINMRITQSSSQSVTATWDTPAGTEVSAVSLWRGDYEEFIDGRYLTADETYTFEGLDLSDDIYQLEVVPMNMDLLNYPVKRGPMGISYDAKRFGIGSVASPKCSSPNQTVKVTDPALEAALRDELDVNSGDITCTDMAVLFGLSANESGIASLDGLQYALNLEELWLGGNEIESLTPLAGLGNLRALDLNENKVSDLGPLQGLTSLEGLYLCCESNAYTDITPLANLTSLIELDIGGHPLGDAEIWPVVSNFNGLTHLWAWDTGIADPSSLGSLSNLQFLELGGNPLQSVSFVEQLPQLEGLNVGWTDVVDVSPLQGSTQLTFLHLGGLDITDIGFLTAFTQLEFLVLEGNQISSLQPLVDNAGLGEGDYVNVTYNGLNLDDFAVDADIQNLLARGIDLEYEPQFD